MKTITIKEFEKLPVDEPIDLRIGEKFLMKTSTEREVKEGRIVTIFEIIRLTERGYESSMEMYKIIKD